MALLLFLPLPSPARFPLRLVPLKTDKIVHALECVKVKTRIKWRDLIQYMIDTILEYLIIWEMTVRNSSVGDSLMSSLKEGTSRVSHFLLLIYKKE